MSDWFLVAVVDLKKEYIPSCYIPNYVNDMNGIQWYNHEL